MNLKENLNFIKNILKGSEKLNLILGMTILFIIIGLAFILLKKKEMERQVAFIKENVEGTGNDLRRKRVIWWIGSTIVWGIVSMFLVILCFYYYE